MNESQETHFGFKKITNANWQQLDEVTKLWCKITGAAKTNEDWIKFFFQPRLNPKVPEEIAKLLEVARGAMIYGWYFKPLLTLGTEQCYRLLDTGTRMRCNQVGIDTVVTDKNGYKRDTRFKENTDALMKRGFLSNTETDKKRWDEIRDARNTASHPQQQLGFDPGSAQGYLESVVDCLNDLFR
jgi:hypothetical protein